MVYLLKMVIFYSYVSLPEGRLQIFWIMARKTRCHEGWFPDYRGGAIYIGPWNEEASEEVDLVAHPT